MKRYFPETIICLMIITIGLIVYAQLCNYDYIFYDDILSMFDPFLTNGFSLEKAGQAFYNPLKYSPYQVPVPYIVRMLLWDLPGANPGKHHLFSLYLHLAIALMFFLFLRLTTKKRYESGFCALLFTIHPINVEAVSWLAGFNGLLEAFFLMICLLCYAIYARNPVLKWYLILFPPFILGLMCKPTIAILPFLLFLLDYWPFRRFSLDRVGIRKLTLGFRRNPVLVEKIPLAILPPLLWTIQKVLYTGQYQRATPVSLSFHPGSIMDFVGHLTKTFYPIDLAICRPAPPAAPMWGAAVLLGVFLAISLAIMLKTHNHKYIFTGWFWFWGASAPVILMIFLSGRSVEDHHLYIPLIGIFVIASFGLSSALFPLKYGRGLFLLTGIIILSMLIPLAYRQTGYWKNSESIFTHALSIHPDNKKVHVNLGDVYMGKKDFDKAIHHYRQFLRLSPDSPLGLTKLAQAMAFAGMTEEARRQYEKALRLSPDYVPACHGLADLMTQTGQVDKAIALYRKALEINPDLFQTLNNLALIMYERGDYLKALSYLDLAIKKNHRYQTAIKNRRLIMERLKENNGQTLHPLPQHTDDKVTGL